MKCLLGSTLMFCCFAAGILRAEDASAVTYTRVADDVKGLVKLGIVHGKSSMVFGSQERLRAKAIAEAEVEAAKLGAIAILITADNFAATPINNVAIEAVAYGRAKDEKAAAGVADPQKSDDKKETGGVVAADPEKIDYTRNPNDVAGRQKLGVVHGKASRVFGAQDKLRVKAIAEAKAEAAKLGATVVLITVDNFEATPINNVSIEAVAYK